MKLQFISIDAIFAVVVFLFALFLLAFVWYDINTSLSLAASASVSSMQAQLSSLSSQLMGPGVPSNWNYMGSSTSASSFGNVSIGLATGGIGNFSMQKIMTFESLANSDYYHSKTLLGVGFDYYVVIKNTNLNITIGRRPQPFDSILTQYVSNSRVNLANAPATMYVYVWTNTSFGVS